jgi:hypothetical protein
MKAGAGFGEYLFCLFVVNFNETEGVVMHANHGFALYHPGAIGRIGGIHRKVVADRQNDKIKAGPAGYELHIHREGCIATIVEGFGTGIYDKTKRVAAIRAIGKTRTMLGHHAFDRKITKIPFASGIHGMYIGDFLFTQPGIYFPGTYHFGAGAAGHTHQVAGMVLVAMRYQYVVGGDRVYIYL